MSKFPFLIAFINVLGVGLKQHPCIYWMSSVFFSLVMIICTLCLNGFEMGMSHNPYDLF